MMQDLKARLNPLFLIVHKSGSFHREEHAAFEQLGLPYALVHLELTNCYRLYDADDSKLAAFRGLLARDNENANRGILLTTGNVNDTFLQRHSMGTPRAIEVNVERNTVNFTLDQFSEQVLKLTKLDWNTLATSVREPITIKCSNVAAKLAASGFDKVIYDVRDLI